MAWKRERSIHVGGKEWQYKIGGFVAIRSPEGKTTYVKKWDFAKIMFLKLVRVEGRDGEEAFDVEIKPSDVQRYIERHILKIPKRKANDGKGRVADKPVRDPRGQDGGGAKG